MRRLARASQSGPAAMVTSTMTRTTHVDAGSSAPKRGGVGPLVGICLVALCAVACADGSADQVMPVVSVGMTSKVMPYYDDGNLTLYQVGLPVPLPVRRPTASELASLSKAPPGTPYPRAPFLLADDESVEIQYVITNVDTTMHTVWVLIDPWNEFVRYHPGVTVVNDDETVPNLGYDLGFSLAPKSRIQGTITADDVHEIAIKLAATEQLLASAQANPPPAAGDNSLSATVLANHLFDVQNRSNSGDPLFTPWIPPVIAGVTGFDLGLRASEPANVAIEIIVTVEDLNGNRFVASDSTASQLGVPPTVLSPPAARF